MIFPYYPQWLGTFSLPRRLRHIFCRNLLLSSRQYHFCNKYIFLPCSLFYKSSWGIWYINILILQYRFGLKRIYKWERAFLLMNKDYFKITFLVFVSLTSLYFLYEQIYSNLIGPCQDWPKMICYRDTFTQMGTSLIMSIIIPILILVLCYLSMTQTLKISRNKKLSKLSLIGLIIFVLSLIISQISTLNCTNAGGVYCSFNYILFFLGYVISVVIIFVDYLRDKYR